MRTIGVVTTGRSDYGIYLPVLRIESDPGLKLFLIVSGMHLSAEFGMTVDTIEADGFAIGDRIEAAVSGDGPEDTVRAMGRGIIGFAESFARFCPDILVVLGDRYDMYPAALAALHFRIPVAHIHGGELTQGVTDDAMRHSITKLSHLHFASTPEYARRIVQMGEEPWRVVCCGAPGLDNLKSVRILSRPELAAACGVDLPEQFLLATYHPVTLEDTLTAEHCREFLAALEACGLPVLFTMANADAGGGTINRMVRQFVTEHESSQMADNLATQAYFSAMKHARAMVGNSSSGIIEAASFELPVVNIGIRQAGRVRGRNVIDAGTTSQEIRDALARGLDPDFGESLKGMANPYDAGGAAEIIVRTLREVSLDRKLLLKAFQDLPEMRLAGEGDVR